MAIIGISIYMHVRTEGMNEREQRASILSEKALLSTAICFNTILRILGVC